VIRPLSVSDPEHLARLHERGVRDKHDLFLVEGVRFVVSACDTGAAIEALIVCPELLHSPLAQMLVRRRKASGTTVVRVSAGGFQRLSILARPQGVAAVVKKRWTALPSPREVGRDLWLAFEHVRSPGNLGTVMRTAQAAGARGLMVLGPSVDPHDPRAVRPTMGAIFRQRLVRCDHRALRRWRARTGCRIVGTSPDPAARDYRTVSYRGPTVLMIGSERRGLSPGQLDLCDEVVRIPMARHIDSLNLAAAASVLLYEVYAQRHPVRARRGRR
jgi:TrmH family RNA methyltransferase